MKEENCIESDLALEEMRKKENEIVTLSSPYETTEKGYKRAQNVKAKPSWKKCQIFRKKFFGEMYSVDKNVSWKKAIFWLKIFSRCLLWRKRRFFGYL
jgi:hypothetical protein